MWINFNCGNCGKFLDSLNQSHDSGEFLFDKDILNCYKCKEKSSLIKITYHRG